jgi:hypothetical protein
MGIMNNSKKYDFLFWVLTILWTGVFTGLGLLALIEKRIYLSMRFGAALHKELHAEVVGWVLLATGLFALAYQLRSSNYLLSSFAVYALYFISLVSYIVIRII